MKQVRRDTPRVICGKATTLTWGSAVLKLALFPLCTLPQDCKKPPGGKVYFAMRMVVTDLKNRFLQTARLT